MGDNTEFSTIKARDSTVSKHKRSQLQVDWINNHNVVLLDRCKSTSDPVNKCRKEGSTHMGECCFLPLRNRYQVLESNQEDQVSTVDANSLKNGHMQDSRARYPIMATCARNIWLLAAMFNDNIVVNHIRGLENTMVAFLFRWHQTPDNLQKMYNLIYSPYG